MNNSAVIYTDGGALKNPGTIGYGFHGYIFDEVSEKPIKGNKWTLTNKGYVKNIHDDDIWIKPLNYIDFIGSSPTIQTNNRAEMLALINALLKIKDLDIKTVVIYTDSQYVSKGINEWMKKWISNNFIKPDGNEVVNSDLWKTINNLLNDLKDVDIDIKWIKAHNGNLGNEIADQLASIGNNLANAGIERSDFELSDVKSYWSNDTERNPLLNYKRIYYNSLSEYNEEGHYYQANPADKDMYIGKRLPGAGYSIVRLKEPDYVVESVIEKQIEVCGGYNGIYMCKLEALFKKEVIRYVEKYGKYALRPINEHKDLAAPDNTLISVELNPTGLSLRAIDNFNYLEDILDTYIRLKDDTEASDEFKLHTEDKTDLFFEIVEKKGKEVKQLRKDITNDNKNIYIDIKRNGKKFKLPVIIGIDLPARNNLKKLEHKDIKVISISWKSGEKSIGYGFIIECEGSIGIWTDFFSGKIFYK